MALTQQTHTVLGEGVEFGFPASEQFDGHSDVMQSSASPTIVMSTTDADLVEMVVNSEVESALGRVLALHDMEANDEQLPPPPPPPAMDDPSDPPPSIDSEFRSPVMSQPQQPADSARLHAPPNEPPVQSADGQAPPPYLIPDTDRDQGQVARPPPYVDLVPP
jgi:hypothetical protein